MAPKYRRTRLWVDPPFQLRLLARMGCYLLVYVLIAFHVAFGFETLAYAGARGGLPLSLGELYLQFLWHQGCLLLTLALILPLVLYDMLKFSHRVAGPLYRCRAVMREMADGKRVAEFAPRKHDLMGELFQAFNALIRAWDARVGAGANGHAGAGDVPARAAEGASPPEHSAAGP